MVQRALIVEDDRSWQQILHELLADAGLEVDLVDNLQTAQQIVSRQSHRLAIIDLSLAGADHNNRDGLQVMDYIRQHDPACVMILLTGFATVEIAVSALAERGAFTCLQKELFNRIEFYELINRALSLPSKGSYPQDTLDDPHHEGYTKETGMHPGFSVLVVEDDAGWRELLEEILADAGYDVNLCSSYGEALSYLRRAKCEVAIIDLSLEGKTALLERRMDEPTRDFEGYHLLSTFKAENTPTIIVSGEATIQDIDRVFQEQQIYAFIEKQTFDRVRFLETVTGAVRSRIDRPLLEKLTSREREVLELIFRGKTNKEIAESLVITPNTVKRHLKAIFEKLDIHTRSAAAAMAANWFGSNLSDNRD
jgi:two-component system, response regulator PdtaR